MRCLRPRRARQSAVQHQSWSASQWKKHTRGGAQFLQMNFHELLRSEPWKVA